MNGLINVRGRLIDLSQPMVMGILKPGGFILADNTLWDGHVVDETYSKDHQTQGIVDFNDHVARDVRTEQVILPLRDGLTIIRKK